MFLYLSDCYFLNAGLFVACQTTREYIEKYLSILLEGIENSFDLRGDEYFDLIDGWIENNLLLGKKPPRNSENIYGEFLSIVVNNNDFNEIIKTKHIQNMISKIRSKT